MSNQYSNIPVDKTFDDSTLRAFDNYYTAPTEIDSATLDAMTGYFTKRGFAEVASENISVTLIKQAKQDGYNPMEILDTLKGLSDVDLSGLVAEILNYNRFKSSSLGYAQEFQTNPEVSRNIIA